MGIASLHPSYALQPLMETVTGYLDMRLANVR
jgi:hypothetical protein